jgi:uncharacterized metal-binding protein
MFVGLGEIDINQCNYHILRYLYYPINSQCFKKSMEHKSSNEHRHIIFILLRVIISNSLFIIYLLIATSNMTQVSLIVQGNPSILFDKSLQSSHAINSSLSEAITTIRLCFR